MTTAGHCRVLERYDDGDYKVTFPEGHEPQAVCSVHPTQIWDQTDWPDWDHTGDGKRVGKELKTKPQPRMKKGKDPRPASKLKLGRLDTSDYLAPARNRSDPARGQASGYPS